MGRTKSAELLRRRLSTEREPVPCHYGPIRELKRPGLKACSGPFVAHARFAPRGSLVDFIGFYGAALAAT